jgi:tetratricopeptide (TPR) repeat protein
LRFLCLITLSAWLGFENSAQGQDGDKQLRLAARANQKYVEAQERHFAKPNDPEGAWQFARACFDRADYATNQVERALIAQQGIAPCRQLLARRVRIAPAHYYLGMNLGQLARTRGLGALKIVDEMEREFKMARALDEQFDHAGPDRNLGLLYLQAPRIGSIGNRNKARQHLQKAVELSPDYPDNRLNYAEACLEWADYHLARRELKALDAIEPKARAEFSGPDWEANWLDWWLRWQRLRKLVEEHTKNPAARGRT